MNGWVLVPRPKAKRDVDVSYSSKGVSIRVVYRFKRSDYLPSAPNQGSVNPDGVESRQKLDTDSTAIETMAERSSEDELEDVFSLAADGTRLKILRALLDEQEPTASPGFEPVSFTTLRERVGVQDSGRFNYHLDELIPQLVNRHDGGYTPTWAGTQLVTVAVSGVFTAAETTVEAVVVDDCKLPECEGTTYASYEAEAVVLECDTCSESSRVHGPPILVSSHDLEANPDALWEYMFMELQKLIRGFCSFCSGPLESRVEDSHPYSDQLDSVMVFFECRECGAPSHGPAEMLLFDHPAVVSLLHDAGVDYRTIFNGLDRSEMVDFESNLASREPVQTEVRFASGDGELLAVLDENLNVVEYERT